MNRAAILSLVVAFSLVGAACGPDDVTDPTATTSSVATTNPAPAPTPLTAPL